MMNDAQDVSFDVSGGLGDSLKYFNIDGTEAIHVDVWVEALEDKFVWRDVLHNTDSYKFILKGPDEAIAEDGKVATGCGRLFSLEKQGVIKLGKDCIFCIDSDDSFIKSFVPGFESVKQSRDHVYATNIYAIDNAFLYHVHIDESFEVSSCQGRHDVAVMPSRFIQDVTKPLFEPYISLCYLEAVGRAEEFSLSRKLLHKAVEKLCDVDLKNYGECSVFKSYGQEVAGISSASLAAINAVGVEGYNAYKDKLSNCGISEANIYLFVRGHSIFDAVSIVYDAVSYECKQNEISRVSAQANTENRIKNVERIWQKFSVYLKNKFHMGRVPVPFLQHSLVRLKQDYSL
ncbi:hypothetical protein LOY44_16870 [Pseudomonas sp. B21-044]|uniref:hypothetical protein n=1 Tax=Pseudomonas sp. B21-044 TaxID=2895488 RepID=UPI00215E948F|nr:hypothetical protein [Pseudomonas sp. B21-044]UVL17673.1 hypothetical protein LOY44_16870 [Pseudomonas sp. B21-044]